MESTPQEYTLVPEQSYIKDAKAEAAGWLVDGIWTIKNVDMTNFHTVSPAKPENCKVVYEVNGKAEDYPNIKVIGANSNVLTYGDLKSKTASSAPVAAKLVMTDGKNSVALAQDNFTVETALPINLAEKSFDYTYKPNVLNEVKVISGTTVTDIKGNKYITAGEEESEDILISTFQLDSFGYSAAPYKQFGVKYDWAKMTQAYADGSEAHLNLSLDATGVMSFQVTDAEMKSDVTVTIPVTITYAFGDVTDNIVVVIKAKESK